MRDWEKNKSTVRFVRIILRRRELSFYNILVQRQASIQAYIYIFFQIRLFLAVVHNMNK